MPEFVGRKVRDVMDGRSSSGSFAALRMTTVIGRMTTVIYKMTSFIYMLRITTNTRDNNSDLNDPAGSVAACRGGLIDL